MEIQILTLLSESNSASSSPSAGTDLYFSAVNQMKTLELGVQNHVSFNTQITPCVARGSQHVRHKATEMIENSRSTSHITGSSRNSTVESLIFTLSPLQPPFLPPAPSLSPLS